MYCFSCEEYKKARYIIRVLVAALSVTTLKMAAIISAPTSVSNVLLSVAFLVIHANLN